MVIMNIVIFLHSISRLRITAHCPVIYSISNPVSENYSKIGYFSYSMAKIVESLAYIAVNAD